MSKTTMAKAAKVASYKLANLDTVKKNQLLLAIRDKIYQNRDLISKSNQLDVQAAKKMVNQGTLSQPLLDRLVFTDEKINQLGIYLEEVAKLDDPVGKKQFAMELDDGFELERLSCPIGVVAVIFESRPEVVIQVTALSLKSGNAVILKGGREASNSNKILFQLINEVLSTVNLEGAVNLIETREDVADLLKLDRYIDLIIPRGGNNFVRYIQENTKIPVLGHSSGICHIYIDSACDPQKAVSVTLDAKLDYPSACNAAETILIHHEAIQQIFPDLLNQLRRSSVHIVGCPTTVQLAKKFSVELETAIDTDWETEYTDLKISVKTVQSLEEAIDHINRYGSHHTDTILTENPETAEAFLRYVDSACVFHNVSTRFSDGYVFGLGAEVGISTNKTHSRGPVGLDGLIIYKYVVRGNGEIRATYSGENARPFSHISLPLD